MTASVDTTEIRDRQREIARRFEDRYRQGVTPWNTHPPEPMVDLFLTLLRERRPEARVLDIGCGNGWLSLKVAQYGFAVWGLDASETAIARATAASARAGLADLTDFRVGDALELPYEDDSFDALVDRGLFHHILPENRQLYLDNIRRVLTPDAYMYLSVFSTRTGFADNRFARHDIERLFHGFAIVAFEEDPYPTQAPAHLLHFILQREG
jgi:SAM-dependent methyltransferase